MSVILWNVFGVESNMYNGTSKTSLYFRSVHQSEVFEAADVADNDNAESYSEMYF